MKKLKTIIILTAIAISAGIAIFIAIRSYQLRKQPTAPTAPESKPEASETEPNECDVDVLLVLDNSGSMNRKENDNRKKIEWAKDAAKAFVDKMTEIKNGNVTNNYIRIGLVSFGGGTGPSDLARLDHPLSTDFLAVKQSIESITFKERVGTCIECGLDIGYKELVGKKRMDGAKQIEVVLSDGCANRNPLGQTIPYSEGQRKTIKKAQEGQSQGIIHYVVGYTDYDSSYRCSYDQETLLGIAGSESRYSFHPGVEEWVNTFVNLATQICGTTTIPPTIPPTSTPSVGKSCSSLSFQLETVATSTPTVTPTPTPSKTSTPTATPTQTPAPASCNNSCNTDTDCKAGLTCSGGLCRNPSCTNETDCTCNTPTPTTIASATGTPSPTPEESLPNAGISTPTIFGIGIGTILLIISLALAI